MFTIGFGSSARKTAGLHRKRLAKRLAGPPRPQKLPPHGFREHGRGHRRGLNAPIAAVTFILEKLIGDLDQSMLSGVVVATAIAAVVEHLILGSNPSFMCRSTTLSPIPHR